MENMDDYLHGLRRESSASSICDAMIYVCFESDYPGHQILKDGSREEISKTPGSVHDTPNWLAD